MKGFEANVFAAADDGVWRGQGAQFFAQGEGSGEAYREGALTLSATAKGRRGLACARKAGGLSLDDGCVEAGDSCWLTCTVDVGERGLLLLVGSHEAAVEGAAK